MQNSDWIAIGSLAISLVSAGFTAFYSRTQHKLNKVQLAEKEEAAALKKQAKLMPILYGNRIIPYYLLITNNGASPARNIRIEYDEGEGCPLLEKETLTATMPYTADLHPGGSIRMSAIEVDSKTGHCLTFVWDDDFATGRRETLAVRTGM